MVMAYVDISYKDDVKRVTVPLYTTEPVEFSVRPQVGENLDIPKNWITVERVAHRWNGKEQAFATYVYSYPFMTLDTANELAYRMGPPWHVTVTKWDS